MSNEVATTGNGQVPADYQAPNAFEAYGHKADQSGLPFIKFKDGEYLAGANSNKVAEGTQVLAIVSDLMIGWQRWSGGAPSDEAMGLLSEGFLPPRRDTLGDHDEAHWETDPDGRKKDPWQRSNKLPLVFDAEEAPLDDPDALTLAFVTGSAGGIGGIGRLCKEYGQHIRTNPDEYPVIELRVDSYYNKKWERNIKTPVFKVVGWTTLDGWLGREAEEVPKTKPAAKPKKEAEPAKAPKKRF